MKKVERDHNIARRHDALCDEREKAIKENKAVCFVYCEPCEWAGICPHYFETEQDEEVEG